MTIQYLTLIGPPGIAIFLSGWLREASLPKWLDTLIAFLVILITAFLWALLAGKLAGDLPADTVIIAAYVAALIAGPMAALHAYLVFKLPSPFSVVTEALSLYDDAVGISKEPPATIAPRLPKSISLPTTPDLLQRNSLLNDPTWRPTVAVAPPPDAVPALKSTEPITAPTPAVKPTPDQGQAAPPSTP